jgi:hypothetical protein
MARRAANIPGSVIIGGSMGRGSVRRLALTGLIFLAGCSINDARTADRAQTTLVGMQEVDLQTCMGAPDQKAVFGGTEILTYYSTSTSSTSLSIPLIGGIGNSYGGYCHTILRLQNGRVVGVRYTGETNAFIAPNAYCASTVRGCVNNPPPPTPTPPVAATTPAPGAVRED